LRDDFPWSVDGFRQSSLSPHYYHILNYNALSKIQNKIMSRVDTFTIIRKHTKNKVRTSLIISSLEFVNNKNLLSYVCFPIIVKVSYEVKNRYNAYTKMIKNYVAKRVELFSQSYFTFNFLSAI
jgi:hypothetical protein